MTPMSMAWIISVILLLIDVVAIMSIVKSSMAGGSKVIWALVVVVFPAIGVFAYFLTHRKFA